MSTSNVPSASASADRKLSIEEYDALSDAEKQAYDSRQAEKEAAEQAQLPYTWTQALDHVAISIPVPEGTRGKDLAVVIKKKNLKIGLKGKEAIVEGEMSKAIKEEDSTWTLGEYLRICFSPAYLL